jgi:DNA-3-methyladenine glycosylase II
MEPLTLPLRGPFSLAASRRFLEGFAPAGREPALATGPLRLAFPVEGGWATAGVAVTQPDEATVVAEPTGAAPPGLSAQLARALSVDVDGTGFADVLDRDPVLAGVAARHRGLRPLGFCSPYEAACWAVVAQRLRIVQAAGLMARIRQAHGATAVVAGAELAAFPAPGVLRRVAGDLPLPEVKQTRLRAIAEAALEGRLGGARLRAMTAEEAVDDVQQLPGIGPFSAELVVVRGAGHPDRFPLSEGRLHASMVELYDLHDDAPGTLATVAQRWAPFRSWAAVLLRVDREERTGEIAHGRRAG